MMLKPLIQLIVILMLGMAETNAAIYAWIGDSNRGIPGDWTEKGNWNPSNRSPNSSDVASFDSDIGYTNNPTLSAAISVLGVSVSGSADKAINGAGTMTVGSSNFLVLSGAGNMAVNPVLAGVAAVDLNSGFTNTLTLTNANTYSGGTIISGGTLKVMNTTGSGTGTGAVTVNATGTLSGTGAVSGNVTVNGGSVNPGDTGIGTLDTGSVTWNANDAWKYDIGASDTSDLLSITGSFIKGSLLTGSQWFFDFQGSTVQGVFRLVEWSVSNTFLASNFGALNLGGGNTAIFQIRDGGTSGGPGYLEVTIVPEPSAYALLAGFMVFGLILVRRRQIA